MALTLLVHPTLSLLRRVSTPVTVTLRDMRVLEKLFVLLTKQPAEFSAEVEDTVLPVATRTLQALEKIATP